MDPSSIQNKTSSSKIDNTSSSELNNSNNILNQIKKNFQPKKVNNFLTPHQTHSHSDTQKTMDLRMVFKHFFYSEIPK